MARRITDVPATYDVELWRQIMRDFDSRFRDLERTVGTYTVSNYTPTRTLNMGTATATDIGNFLCTLVADLQGAGRLGK